MSTDLVQFDELRADVTQLVAPALEIKVTDFKSSHRAVEAAKQIKELAKQVDARRKELVDPLNREVKRINEYAKGIASPLEAAEAHIKAQLRDFTIEQEKIQAEERRKAEVERLRLEAELRAKQEAERQALEAQRAQEAESADIFGGDEPGVADAPDAHDALLERQAQEQAILKSQAKAREFDIAQQGIKNTAKIWKCEIANIDLVPVQYLVRTLNEQAVIAMARAGNTDIPGVRIWQELSVRIGSKTYVPRAALNGGRPE